MRILFIGDIFGKSGRDLATQMMPALRKEYQIDFCIVNGENTTHGRGIGMDSADELLAAGADCITMGNHTWGNYEINSIIDDYPIIRPANFAEGLPGRGSIVLENDKGMKLAVLNLQGRVYMENCDNPFTRAAHEVEVLRKETPNIFIDFHAEASAEKIALAYYLQGRVSAVIGTHTHVQTADEQILEGGTAYLTDVGMTGPTDGVIGMDRRNVVNKFVKCIPVRFEPSKGPATLHGVIIDVDESTGRATQITRISGK